MRHAHLARLPDGETGIRFLQDVLAENPAIEYADVLPFEFTQWDSKVVREIPRLRIKPGAVPKAGEFKTGYADMALESWGCVPALTDARRDPSRGQVPGQPSDTDRANLQ